MNHHWPGVLPDPCEPPGDMRCVLANPDAAGTAPLYYMYRDLALSEDGSPVARGAKRPVRRHRHSPGRCRRGVRHGQGAHLLAPAGIGYPELYQVLAGEAHYLLQRKDLSDGVVVTAKVGEFVLIPPGYGHVTINPGQEDLVMANPGLGRVCERVCALRADARRSILRDGRWGLGAEYAVSGGYFGAGGCCRGGAGARH
ncbi:glucose-6-phosphate isomerase family protein [Methanoculleus frigidifontis]|uniref:glucose-6-phosphate isomerase family protein n=1 Tax=Methanoculleus frigidifontis TaxID=2584085 RepID=UPI003F5C3A9F